MKNLVIVESPTKAKTIGRFLGDDYTIKFSMGHVMDLPKSKLGVDVDDKFKPQLEVVKDKMKIISELKTAAKSAPSILLATDPDREGEAIASNIRDILSSSEKLKGKSEKFKRIVFHEITKDAILDALTHPRKVDKNLVDAQIARRVLDRLVGYQISPILWQKVRRGLSAGRVQSVALRLIVEREREIEKFVRHKYWTVHLLLTKQTASEKQLTANKKMEEVSEQLEVSSQKSAVEFELVSIRDSSKDSGQGKIETQETHKLYDGDYTISKTIIDTPKAATDLVQDIKTKNFVVADVNERESRRSPNPPYTTSTLQQEASRRFGYPGKRTMSLAQKLYEEGFITYHRTDSVMIALAAQNAIRSYVGKNFGEKYVPENPRVFSGKQKSAQEAHEGIRPTHFNRTTLEVKAELGDVYAKLYDLIWRRAVASQMSDAIIESTTVVADSQVQSAKFKVQSSDEVIYRVKASGSVLKFDGFLKVNPQALQDRKLPQFVIGEDLVTKGVRADEHETPSPPRYNDASLIQALEEKGIGRPSTYASIISTLTDRTYVERVERRFVPTSVGEAVNDFLVTNFSDIDDIPFTAQMEDDLDDVADGKKEWETMMREFYAPFAKELSKVKGAARVKIEVEETSEKCPECGQANLVIRTGKFGKFLSCARFPDCKCTKPFVETTNIPCPKDNGQVIIKKTRKGRKFYGCSNYPKCDFASWKLEDIKGVSKKAIEREKERTGVESEEKTR